MQELFQIAGLTLKISIIIQVFAIGLGTNRRDATYLFRQPRLLLNSILARNVAVPIIAILLIEAFAPRSRWDHTRRASCNASPTAAAEVATQSGRRFRVCARPSSLASRSGRFACAGHRCIDGLGVGCQSFASLLIT